MAKNELQEFSRGFAKRTKEEQNKVFLEADLPTAEKLEKRLAQKALSKIVREKLRKRTGK